jgi:hypothetical protein
MNLSYCYTPQWSKRNERKKRGKREREREREREKEIGNKQAL